MMREIWKAGVLAGVPAVLGVVACGGGSDGSGDGAVGTAAAGGGSGAAAGAGSGSAGATSGGSTAGGLGGGAAGSVGTTGGAGGGVVGSGGAGGATDGGAGGAPAMTFCDHWRALADGELPGFATDSYCVDYTDIPTGDVACSGADAAATVATVQLAQTHVQTPTSERYTHNESGAELVAEAQRPKFRLISHRPALLLVGVTGSGTAPEVRVTARRGSEVLGSLCLAGPASLPADVPAEPRLDDRFTVTLPAAWIRPGLELDVTAGTSAAPVTIAETELQVAGGVRHIVVEAPTLLYGETEVRYVPMYMPRMADELPVQSLVWVHFPVPIVMDPFVKGGDPPRVIPAREGSWDEVGEVLDMTAEIRRANGQMDESQYFGGLDDRYWGGGLGGTMGAAGPATQLMIRHEGGHAYGLPHLEDAYRELRYPFAKRTDGSGCVLGVDGEDGCGVGPDYKYLQYFGVVDSVDEQSPFLSPWGDTPGVYVRDPMAGGGDNWFGTYTVQWILDNLQSRSFWDLERLAYVRYDAGTGEFVEDTEVRDDGWYWRPVERDVPVYTIFGSYSSSVAEANVIQPPLHYRGHLPRIMDPTDDEHLAWLRDHDGGVCYWGCDLVVRVTHDGAGERTYLVNREAGTFTRFAINVPDLGRLQRVELWLRPMSNGGGGNVDEAVGSTYLDSATLVAARDL